MVSYHLYALYQLHKHFYFNHANLFPTYRIQVELSKMVEETIISEL